MAKKREEQERIFELDLPNIPTSIRPAAKPLPGKANTKGAETPPPMPFHPPSRDLVLRVINGLKKG